MYVVINIFFSLIHKLQKLPSQQDTQSYSHFKELLFIQSENSANWVIDWPVSNENFSEIRVLKQVDLYWKFVN